MRFLEKRIQKLEETLLKEEDYIPFLDLKNWLYVRHKVHSIYTKNLLLLDGDSYSGSAIQKLVDDYSLSHDTEFDVSKDEYGNINIYQ